MRRHNPEIRTGGSRWLTRKQARRQLVAREGIIGFSGLWAAAIDWAIDRDASTKRKVGQVIALATIAVGLVFTVVGLVTMTLTSIVGGVLVASLGAGGLFFPRITAKARAADDARKHADFEQFARNRGHRDGSGDV